MNRFLLTILMYHYVRDPGDQAEAGSGIPGYSLANFEEQIEHLARRYTMIAWPDLQVFLQGEKLLPENACLLTFDDGMRDHYINVFPALKSRGLSGLFFYLARRPEDGLVLGHKIHYLLARLGLDELRAAVRRHLTLAQYDRYRQAEQKYTARYSGIDVFKAVLQRDLSDDAETILSTLIAEHIGSEEALAREYYLTPAQMAQMMTGGMHFGGHSHSHPWFDWIDDDARDAEIKASADGLSSLGSGPWAFAYPYGGLSPEAPRQLGAHGFAAAFTTQSRVAHDDPFYIGRLDGEELSPSLSNLEAVVSRS